MHLSSSTFPSAADQIRRLKYFRNAVIALNGLDPDQDPFSVSPDLGQYVSFDLNKQINEILIITRLANLNNK